MKTILLLVALSIFLSACSKPQQQSNTGFPSAEAKIAISRAGVNPSMGYLVARSGYHLVDVTWMDSVLGSAMRNFTPPSAPDIFGEPAWKCTDYTATAVAIGTARYPGAAIGEFWYTTDAGKGHAVVVAIVSGDGYNGKSVLFWDPQLRRSVHLSKQEISRCIAWKM